MCLIEYIIWHATLVDIVVVNVCSLATLDFSSCDFFFLTIARIVILRFNYILDKS